jgi:SAM-dependent methyltransferase
MLRAVADWVDLQFWYLIQDFKAVGPTVTGRLLDVGCGDRPYEAFFPNVAEYVGVEHAATFAMTAASGAARQPDFLYDGVTLPFSEGSFDSVLCAQVLEHTPEPQRLIGEMARVLKDGGTMILTAPFSFRLHEEPHDYFRYTPHGFRAMLSQVGVEPIEVHPHGGLWSVLAHKLNTFLAFRVARIDALTQALGKRMMEKAGGPRARLWTLPAVAPTMLALSAGARVLDRAIPEPSEALSFLILAKKHQRA